MLFLNIDNKKVFLLNFSFTIIVCSIIFFIAKFTFQYLTPFVIAIIIATIMQRPAGFLASKIKIPKGIIAAVLAVGFYLIFAVLLFLAVYRMIAFSGRIAKEIPELISFISKNISRVENIFFENIYGISENALLEFSSILKESLNNLTVKATNIVSAFAGRIVKSAPSFLFSTIAAVVASCYVAKDFEGLRAFLRGLCSKRVNENISIVKSILTQSVFKILKGYLLLSAITFIVLIICFVILKIDNFILLAAAISIIDLLPVLGTGIVLIPWGIFSLISGNSFLGFGLIALYFLLIITRNFLEPKIIGTQIGINPLFILITMFAGLKIMGFLGLIIFPITLIVVIKYYKNEMETESLNGQN